MLRKSPLAFSLFVASWISFQPADAQEALAMEATQTEATPEIEPSPIPGAPAQQETPAQEENATTNVVTQAESTSTSEGTDLNLLSNFPIHLSLDLHAGYDDNTSTGSAGQGSFFTSAGLTLFYGLHGAAAGVRGAGAYGARPGGAFGASSNASEPTQLTIRSGANVTYYSGATRKTTDVNTFLDLSLTHYFSPRVTVATSISASYKTEPDFSSNVGVENVRANYFYTVDSASLEYHWTPLVSTLTSEQFDRVQYESSSIATSINRIENTLGEEFRLSYHPDIILIANYRFEIVDYDSAPLDSTTHFALVGIQKEFNPQLKAVVRGGVTFRSYKDDGNRTDPYAEGSLVYTGAHNSTLTWNFRYGVEEPNSSGTAPTSSTILSRTTFRTGLELAYALSARVRATLNAYYHHDDNQGLISTGTVSSGFNSTGIVSSGFSGDSFDVSLGVHYALRRYFTLGLDYEHLEAASGQSAQNYSRNRYSAGLTFTY